ncbi:YcnI family copper-binding membrane protein [Paenibacillus xylanexedens]|uniref:YcnI family copper-binding membrane protein n=1 Tax=Paenibacillus xylanexedens TaxID=528191 RepID=UPI001F0CBDB6|nr:YcnI family protein [Paenibacillus xylanexedens]
MKKTGLVSFLMVLLLFTYASAASAHVGVYPKEVAPGSYEKFTVRVPNESNNATIKVTVAFPAEVNISRVQPLAGWKYEFIKNTDGSKKMITWTTTGDGIKPDEFAEFNLSGKVSDDAKEIKWKATQTYEDGKIVEWIGEPDSEKPAAVTTVNANTKATVDAHSVVPATTQEPKEESPYSKNTLFTAVAVSIVAVIIALIALFRKRD